eukprot:scaffold14203_cov47-Prasinocladus_malaysianus.AAC.3
MVNSATLPAARAPAPPAPTPLTWQNGVYMDPAMTRVPVYPGMTSRRPYSSTTNSYSPDSNTWYSPRNCLTTGSKMTFTGTVTPRPTSVNVAETAAGIAASVCRRRR